MCLRAVRGFRSALVLFRRGAWGTSGLTAAEGSLRAARARRRGRLAQDETDGHLHVPRCLGARLVELPQQQPGGLGALAATGWATVVSPITSASS